MISFVVSILALLVGYFTYGRFVERVFGPDNRKTPAVAHPDGVDYVELPTWRVFMIQFLNIAGTGPIFGALIGALYGPVAFVWIVLGCIFAGATHDYLSGMLSLRHDGANQPSLIGRYLGSAAKNVMLVFSVLLMVFVGAVFVYSPAVILGNMAGSQMMWVVVVMAYYLVATMLPINKIVGKIYPLFAVSLLFMALAFFVILLIKHPAIPELWTDMATANKNEPASLLGLEAFYSANPVFPSLFITIACGAISGFHATQSPLMARCLKHERLARPVFYGAMVCEGIVALIWAAVGMWFFYDGGWRTVVSPAEVEAFVAQAGAEGGQSLIQYFNAPHIVQLVCSNWLGVFGGILALLGVVAAPITTGDTALRSARLMIADALKMEQRSIAKRIVICVPLFAVSIVLLVWQINNPDGFNMVWRYVGWATQALSVFTLWAATVYLVRERKLWLVTLIPAIFMTTVCVGFLLISDQALGTLVPDGVALALTCCVPVASLVWFVLWYRREQRNKI